MVRHAESNGNANGGDYSLKNAGALSTKGLAQAETLGSCLESLEIVAVIVSPQQRALPTIAPYLERTGRTGEVWPELAEACWQEERQPPADNWHSEAALLPSDIAQYFSFRDGQAIQPASTDMFSNGLRRVCDALERVEKAFGGTEQTVLMVSHRFFIGEMLNRMLRRPEHEVFHHENCGMTLMNFSTVWQMEFCNRQPHEAGEPILRMGS
jgi:broad specificity phosphatase PhoE